MFNLAMNLEIEGDYIDSFIYMGVLFLVDFNLNISSYQWDEVCDYILSRNGFIDKRNAESVISYSKNGRVLSHKKHTPIDTFLKQDELKTFKCNKHTIGFYPSDIYIYSKKVYYAHEKGVFYTELKHEDGGVQDRKPKKIFDTRCFSISPNTLDRLALAAGSEGVLTCDAGYFSDSRKGKDFRQISNKDSIDIEWIDNYLMINNIDRNVIVNKFKQQPNDLDFINHKDKLFNILKENNEINEEYFLALKSEFPMPKNIIKEIKNIIVSMKPEEMKTQKKYAYSWTSGDYNFFLDEHLKVDVFKDTELLKTKAFTYALDKKIDKVRTSGCGTYLESDNKLLALSDDNLIMIDDDIVNWRVFPRAKKHCNQLHIVKDDRIKIMIFDLKINDPFSSYLKKHS
jgi:hypothetical protein